MDAVRHVYIYVYISHNDYSIHNCTRPTILKLQDFMIREQKQSKFSSILIERIKDQ